MANPLIGQGFIRDRKGGTPVEIVDLEARQRIAALEENEGSGPIELPDNYVTTDTEQTLTAKKVIPQIETGTLSSSYFQTRKMRGEGSADSYYHAIDFGFANHNQVDFYEYGGIWNFWNNTTATATTDTSNLALGITLSALKNRNNTYTFPGKTGTFALTSDIPEAVTESDVTGWGFAKTSEIPTDERINGLIDAKIPDPVTDEHINSLIDIKLSGLDGSGVAF